MILLNLRQDIHAVIVLCLYPQAHDHLNEAVISVNLQQDIHSVIALLCLYPQAHDRLNEAVISVNLQQDIHTVITQKGVQGPRQPEQILIDCYVSRQGSADFFSAQGKHVGCEAKQYETCQVYGVCSCVCVCAAVCV